MSGVWFDRVVRDRRFTRPATILHIGAAAGAVLVGATFIWNGVDTLLRQLKG